MEGSGQLSPHVALMGDHASVQREGCSSEALN